MPTKTDVTSAVPAQGTCRCEATIAPSVLDGYACGDAACWRTAVARASFEAFVADLIRRREGKAMTPDMP